jgi:hypothetical protein
MKAKLLLVGLAMILVATTVAPSLAELRQALGREEIVEIDNPVLVSRAVLQDEMRRNSGLADYIRTYGYPDYVEVQEIQPDWPWAAYETRLYYVRRQRYLAFGRVNVAPYVTDYGLKKFEGPFESDTMARLLTAQPAAPLKSEGDYGEKVLPIASSQ